ncbi:MAG: response regulator [Wenzhouxiangellaceae bacterium]|nr:response regulator [Wenzhouxiangellaceae bacterium]
MKPRILIVDDEAAIRNMLAFSLSRAEMDVDVAGGGEEAMQHLRRGASAPDLIVMDWMMPGLDGLQLTRTLRSTPGLDQIPIIMLTARGREADRTCGLDSGADDYVVKPFSTRELISRVRAVLRRASPPVEAVEPVLEVGRLTLEPDAHRALVDGGVAVNMGPTEFRLLKLFMQSPGRAWSREQLLTTLWGSAEVVEERTIDVHIRRLRKALTPHGLHAYVQTVRGHGYRFSDVV